MSSQELFEYVEEQLELNPVLEVVEPDEYTDDMINDLINEDIQQCNEWKESDRYKTPEEDFSDSEDEAMENCPAASISIKEHLQIQLNSSGLDEKQKRIGEYIIDNIDENGYLQVDLPEIAEYFNIPQEKVDIVLKKIQNFDPPGICARNLKECLLIQLRQINAPEDAIRVVETCLDDLAANKISSVSRQTGLDAKRVKEIYEFIKTLEPKPGREFCDNAGLKYVCPDIIIRKVKKSFEATLNEEAVPCISISPYYRKLASDDASNDETRKFIQEKIESALTLIRYIEERKGLIKNVGDYIVNRQAEFFENGIRHLKPMKLKDAARDLGMDANMLKRIICGKYIQCSWGYLDMGSFFSEKGSVNPGKRIDTEKLKKRFSDLIESEDKSNPYSDKMLTEILNREGIKISRRTVIKYRNEMGFGPAAMRKK